MPFLIILGYFLGAFLTLGILIGMYNNDELAICVVMALFWPLTLLFIIITLIILGLLLLGCLIGGETNAFFAKICDKIQDRKIKNKN